MYEHTKLTLTTTAGCPVSENQNSLTAGPRGPVLLQDVHLLEKLSHQNRERIPERTVHAKGWGAHGKFTVTQDITKYTKATIFSKIGKQTALIIRMSNVAGELGAAERDVRGFAVKLYTEEGNWDIVGNNTAPKKLYKSYHCITTLTKQLCQRLTCEFLALTSPERDFFIPCHPDLY